MISRLGDYCGLGIWLYQYQTVGGRSYSAALLCGWNSLPDDVSDDVVRHTVPYTRRRCVDCLIVSPAVQNISFSSDHFSTLCYDCFMF